MKPTGPTRRVTCSADGCSRYRSLPDDGHVWVWMCADHWSRVPKWRRQILHRVQRLRRRYGYSDSLNRRWSRIWRRLVSEANRRPPREIEELLGG